LLLSQIDVEGLVLLLAQMLFILGTRTIEQVQELAGLVVVTKALNQRGGIIDVHVGGEQSYLLPEVLN